MPPSISFYKALSDLPSLPILHIDPLKLHALDSNLYFAGVRPGQAWTHLGAPNTRTLVLGYSNIGFVLATATDGANLQTLVVSPCSSPRNEKEAILESAIPNRTSSPTRRLQSILPASMTDKSGNVLPGRGIDALLSTLGIFSIHYYDATLDKAQYVINCEGLHYTLYDRPVAIGGTCTPECSPERPEANLRALTRLAEMVLRNVYQAPSVSLAHPTMTPMEGLRASLMTPRIVIPGVLTQAAVLVSNRNGQPRFELDNNDAAKEHKASRQLSETLMRSGEVLSLFGADRAGTIEPAGFIRIYKKRCKLYHFEISGSNIFTGQMDLNLLDRLTKYNNLYIRYRVDGEAFDTRLLPVMNRCPICNSNLPILNIATDFTANRVGKKILPYVETKKKTTPELYVPACGDLVTYHGKSAMVIDIKTFGNNKRFTLLLQNGRTRRIWNAHKTMAPSSSGQYNSFLDRNGLLYRKSSMNKWHKLLFPGSRMVVKPSGPIDIAGSEVTVAGFPVRYRREKIGWEVQILESPRMLDVYNNLTIASPHIITPGMTIEGRGTTYTVEDITEDTVALSSGDKKEIVSETGLKILLSREELKIGRQFTIESLLMV